MRDVRGRTRRRWLRWATVSSLLVAQWSQAVEARVAKVSFEPEPTVLPIRETYGNWKDVSGTYVQPEVTNLDENEVGAMGVTTTSHAGEEGDLLLDPRRQYEYLHNMATAMVDQTMDQLDKTVGRNQAADEDADAEQAGEWVTEGADDASAGGEVQLDEDGNEMDQQIRDELRGEQEILVLQPDERLYLRFYRNLTLGLGVALLACMGLVAWVVCNGGLRPSSSVKAALERIQWRRLPTAISAAFSMSLDRDALDPKIAQRLRQAEQCADDSYKSLTHSAMEIAGMRSP